MKDKGSASLRLVRRHYALCIMHCVFCTANRAPGNRSINMLQASSSSLPSITDLLAKGKQSALAGQRELAREMLAYVVYLDPKNSEGWLWLSGVVDFPQQVRYCLE